MTGLPMVFAVWSGKVVRGIATRGRSPIPAAMGWRTWTKSSPAERSRGFTEELVRDI